MAPPRRSIPGFLLSPLASIGYILVRPRLLLLAVCPILLNLILLATLFSLLYLGVANPWAGALEMGMPDALEGAVRVLLQVLLALVTLLVSGVVCYLLASILGSPFYDAMSERVERECLRGKPGALAAGPGVVEGALHSMLEAARRLLVALPILLLLLGLVFVPFVGAPLAFLLGMVKAAFFLSLDAYSYSLDRRKMTLSEKIKWLRARPRPTFGLGAALAFLLLIPCGFVWFPPLAAVAATREFCRMELGKE